MQVVSINSVPYGSTAEIMIGVATISNLNNIPHITSTGYSTHPSPNIPENNIAIGNIADKFFHIILARLTGRNGGFSRLQTKKFLNKIDKLKPDIIHLHNLHGWYINIPMLFKYIKKNNIRTIWTLHDCWSFTGHCPHFTMIKCDKWKTGCFDCPLHYEYPQSIRDNSKFMYALKKECFTGVKDLTIVTPSRWLADMVKQSYLKDYPIFVINNGIDLEVFNPSQSDFRSRYNIGRDKKILLGVAFGWSNRKGLDVFVELEASLDKDRFQIVLVGTDDEVDKKLPSGIISIHRTQNQNELAEIYSAADLFVNPTREENYPTVNMEALACGTPVITFRTGGSPEIIDESCGAVVDCDDIASMCAEIIRIFDENLFTEHSCIERARSFNRIDRYEEYISLYKR